MKELLKNLGYILILAGVITLAVGFLTGSLNNRLLTAAMSLIVGGLAGYILINKKMQ